MLSPFILMGLMALGTPKTPSMAAAPAPAAAAEQHVQYATFVPVCRDARGAWDRRACRHVARRDPHRFVLVAREQVVTREIA